MINDQYDIALLKEVLGEIGYEFFYFSKIDTTMRIIEDAAQKRKNTLTVALTDHQTSGTGRKSRKWQDRPSSSLMLSVLFSIPAQTIATFADLVSLTVCQTIRKVTGISSIQIKYPNDLVIEDRKLGGILVKNIYDKNNRYLGTNLGIGLNIHYTSDMLEKFSTDYPATALDICTGSFVKRQDLLIEILRGLRYLNTEVEVIESNPKARELFEEKWRNASSMMGRKVVILKQDKAIEEGLVVNTGMGRGIELETSKGRTWFSLFETDMKARILN